jgi:hypothetical protein
VSEWERGEKKPSGPSLKLLSIVKSKGLDAISFAGGDGLRGRHIGLRGRARAPHGVRCSRHLRAARDQEITPTTRLRLAQAHGGRRARRAC